MSKEIKSKGFEVDADYTSVYADGMLVSLEDNDTVRIIFYENVYAQNPQTGIDKDRKISRMKFEVRLSSDTMMRFESQLGKTNLPKYLNFMHTMDHEKIHSKTTQEIESFERDIRNRVFDTDKISETGLDVTMDKFHDIMDLILKMREKNGK